MDNAIRDLNNRVFSTMPIDHLHRFPKDTALKQRWAEKIKRKNWKPTSNSVLCSRHFDTSCYQVPPGVGRKVRLFPDALPTNFPEFPEHMKPVSAKSGKKPRKVPASRVPSTINQAPTAEPAALVEPMCYFASEAPKRAACAGVDVLELVNDVSGANDQSGMDLLFNCNIVNFVHSLLYSFTAVYLYTYVLEFFCSIYYEASDGTATRTPCCEG
jgi:hypothetical protein